jgi:hypothetical protein
MVDVIASAPSLLGFLRRLPRRTAVIALAVVTLQVGAVGSYFLYVCSMQGGASAPSCCCPTTDDASASATSDGSSSDGPGEPSFERASCCDIQAVRVEPAPRDSVRPGAGADAAAAPPVLIATLGEPPLATPIHDLTFAADRQVRGPPILLLKQSLLR